MAILSIVAAGLLALSVASARQCQDVTVSVDISARNGQFNLATPTTNIDVTNFILNSVQNGHNCTQEILVGYETIAGTYQLQTTFCKPDTGKGWGRSGQTVQLLTHGIGFDRSYWDLPYQYPEYSYIATAVDQYGFSTLSWDRLGIGMSQHGDPVSQIQAPLEVAALIALTQMLKQGSIPGVSKFDKVVHVGHSFGSVQSFALSRDMPDLSDGLVLTGWSASALFYPYFLLGGNFVSVIGTPLESKYVAGYFTPGNPSGVQTNFFAPNHFDPNILPFAYAIGQPVTAGELLTIAGAGMGTSTAAVPVLVITGMRDLPYCGGDCTMNGQANIPAQAQSVLPNAQPFDVNIVPNAGHALNLDIDHAAVFTTVNDWLTQNGFGGGPVRRRVARKW